MYVHISVILYVVCYIDPLLGGVYDLVQKLHNISKPRLNHFLRIYILRLMLSYFFILYLYFCFHLLSFIILLYCIFRPLSVHIHKYLLSFKDGCCFCFEFFYGKTNLQRDLYICSVFFIIFIHGTYV